LRYIALGLVVDDRARQRDLVAQRLLLALVDARQA